MIVNFNNIEVRPTIGGGTVKDNFTKVIAEAIYQRSTSLAETEFALRLYKADGDIEVNDSEKEMILKILDNFRWWAQEPIRKMLGEK